jgi:hypothetical protein
MFEIAVRPSRLARDDHGSVRQPLAWGIGISTRRIAAAIAVAVAIVVAIAVAVAAVVIGCRHSGTNGSRSNGCGTPSRTPIASAIYAPAPRRATIDAAAHRRATIDAAANCAATPRYVACTNTACVKAACTNTARTNTCPRKGLCRNTRKPYDGDSS